MSGTPPVSIDEAIELFLAIACPGGVPEGVDREALVAKLREQVAADRPEWAAASAPPRTAAPPSPEASYSQIKAAAIERARQAEIPTDPEEQYLEERRQEARRNRERREEEAEEAATRQRLIRNMMAEKKAASAGHESTLRLPHGQIGDSEVLPPEIDEQMLERALRIRKLLVERHERSRSIDVGAPAASHPGRPSVSRPALADSAEAPAVSRGLDVERSAAALNTRRAAEDELVTRPALRERREPPAPPPASWREVADVARDLLPDEQARIVRGFNESKRALLKKREDLLAQRWPKREDILAERRPKQEDILAERRPKREDLLAERRPKREDILAERQPKREDLLAERRPKREDLLAERRPKRDMQAEALGLTERVEAAGLRIEADPGSMTLSVRESGSKQSQRLRLK